MASERAEALPEDVEEWLAERADSGERSREELLALAVDFYRFLASRDEVAPDAEDIPEVPAIVERLDALDADVAALSDAVDEKIEDVRERVIQVKREADGKAPADHDHPELAEVEIGRAHV